jgi:hypothetical protein
MRFAFSTGRTKEATQMADASAEPSRQTEGFWHPVLQFAIKFAIAAAIVTFALSYLVDNVMTSLVDTIDERVARLESNLSGRHFWVRLEQELDRAAAPQHGIRPERQQKLLQDVRILADRARPFLLEAGNAFAAQSQPGVAKEK